MFLHFYSIQSPGIGSGDTQRNCMNNTEQPQTAPAHPQPVLQLKITAMSDGNVNVNNFPQNLLAAMDILFVAFKTIVVFFVNQARNGTLDDKYTVIQKKIITKDKTLVGPDGKPVQ